MYIKKRHNIPELNTTSTADISFMMLIFFLVTTSMDSDKGLNRQLPPMNDNKIEVLQDIDRNKVFSIQLLPGGLLKVNDVPRKMDDGLKKDIRRFMIEKGKEHVIELQIYGNAEYEHYFHLQNFILKAYKEVRNAASKKKYGTEFTKCTKEQQDEILKYYPQRITEKDVEDKTT